MGGGNDPRFTRPIGGNFPRTVADRYKRRAIEKLTKYLVVEIKSIMPEIVDDKSQYCIPFLLDRLRVHTERHRGNPDTPPFFIGLNGVQGAGKTVLVSRSRTSLSLMPRDLVKFPRNGV